MREFTKYGPDCTAQSEATPSCANKECENFDPKAVHSHGSQSSYCSLKCKYDDPDRLTNNETYGD